jgi:outer membrane cobalamin receptor
MINGVPMNDMEWGGVYWSNWAGLSDVTRSMQVQRGLGASKVAAPSLGGSINVVTRSTDARKGGAVSYGIGNDGTTKLDFQFPQV